MTYIFENNLHKQHDHKQIHEVEATTNNSHPDFVKLFVLFVCINIDINLISVVLQNKSYVLHYTVHPFAERTDILKCCPICIQFSSTDLLELKKIKRIVYTVP